MRAVLPRIVKLICPIGSSTGQRALDWLNFFVADVQTGFGPFIAVYLVTQQWTETHIGLALSIGTFSAMVSQVPAGALVDAISAKRGIALAALIAIALSAVLFALWPEPLPIIVAEVAHGFASCLFAPAAAAISLALVGHGGLERRLARNARYRAVGNALSAALMGVIGASLSSVTVFWLTAALTVPAALALAFIPAAALSYREAAETAQDWKAGLRRLIFNRGVLVFTACCALFGLGNAALLPLASADITASVGEYANLIIGASLVVPQMMVAGLSSWIGNLAQRRGRRLPVILGLSAVALRALLLALFLEQPVALVLVQALDGVSGAMLGVMLPLLAADLTRGSNRFNLCMGVFGLANGLGATLSTSIAGIGVDYFGSRLVFVALATAGMAAAVLAWIALPETRALATAAVMRTPGSAGASTARPGSRTPKN